MKAIVAVDGSGGVKIAEFGRTVDTSLPDSSQPHIRVYNLDAGPVSRMLLLPDRRRIVLAHRGGQVAIHNLDEELSKSVVIATDAKGVIGLCLTGDEKEMLVVTEASGRGRVFGLSQQKHQKTRVPSFTLSSGLSVVCNHPAEPDVFLSAGPQQLPEVWLLDAAKGEVVPLWKAKNPKNTRVDLPEPNLVTGATFIPLPGGSDTYHLATVTSHGKLRIYDTQQGRPTHVIEVGKLPLLSVVAGGDVLTVGDTNSRIAQFTMPVSKDSKLRLLGNYAKVQGSTRALSRRNGFVACGGLDRYVRVFELGTRAAAGKVYVGEEIVDIVLVSEDDEEQMEADDAVWNQIAPDQAPKRRKVDDTRSQSDDSNSSEESEGSGDSNSSDSASSSASEDSGFEGFSD